MGYRIVDLESIEPNPEFEADRRSIGRVVDLEHVGLSRYLAAPGEQVPKRYHYHDTQEELFYVVRGELHVETPEKEFVVNEDEVFVAEPDSPHRAFNPSGASEDVLVIAIGAPDVADGHFYEETPTGPTDRPRI